MVPFGVVVTIGLTLVQIPSISLQFSSFFLNLTHSSIPDVSPVLKYAKIVAPSVGLMPQLTILDPQKASDR